MSIYSIIERIIGSPEPEAVDIEANADLRQAILEKARLAAHPAPIRNQHRDRDAESTLFVRQMTDNFGISDLRHDMTSIDRLDAFVDAARESRPRVLSGLLVERMASWLGEYVRREEDLRWTADGILTDGRAAYDPAAAISARSASASAPTLSHSIRHAMARTEMLALA